jgi:uncharacterized LabA/DUF88 family protein
MKKPIVYAFIDSQNLNLGVKSQGWNLDFKKFGIYLKDKYKVSKAFIFIGYVAKYQKLYRFLEKSDYKLIYKPVLKPVKSNPIKGNVDAELVLHTMIEYSHYDKAVIITGDGDFYCLVDYLLKKKKLARLLIPNRSSYSRLLYKFQGQIDFISNLKVKLNQQKKGVSLSETKL